MTNEQLVLMGVCFIVVVVHVSLCAYGILKKLDMHHKKTLQYILKCSSNPKAPKPLTSELTPKVKRKGRSVIPSQQKENILHDEEGLDPYD